MEIGPYPSKEYLLSCKESIPNNVKYAFNHIKVLPVIVRKSILVAPVAHFFVTELSSAKQFHDAGHLVGDANLLRTFRQTFLTIGTASGPCFYVG